MDNILAMVDPKDRLDIEYIPQPEMSQHLCEHCQIYGWAGPRMLAKKAENPNMPLLCVHCAVKTVRFMQKEPQTIHSLGGK